MEFMAMKKVLVESLKKAADKMVTSSKASLFTYGMEEMPKSLKKRR